MRLLLASNLYPPDVLGGYELLAADVVGALRARGHAVHVLTTGRPRTTEPEWIHRELALVRAFSEPARLDRVRHTLHARAQASATGRLVARGFDAAIVMSMRRLGLHVPRALQRLGVPTVFCFNDDWLLAHRPANASTRVKRAVVRALEGTVLGAHTWQGVAFDRVVYISHALREALQRGGAPVPEGVVRFQGVDRALFHPRAVRPVSASPRLLFAGRVHPTKGVDVAILATARLRAEGRDARLTIAGTGAPDEIARLVAIARREGIEHAIEWRGFVERTALGDVYRSHDVFLFPSLWEEPAGLTYLEAMACGVPVAAIARGGAKEILVDGENALVGDDARTLASAVARMVHAPALVERIVRGGERTVRERASLDRYVDAIEEAAAAEAHETAA